MLTPHLGVIRVSLAEIMIANAEGYYSSSANNLDTKTHPRTGLQHPFLKEKKLPKQASCEIPWLFQLWSGKPLVDDRLSSSSKRVD